MAEIREIDGTTFRVGQLALKKQRAVLLRLTKLIGPALAELAKSEDVGSLLDLDQAVVFGAMSRLMMNAKEEDLEFLCEEFGNVTAWLPPQGTGAYVSFGTGETAIGGRMSTMFKWLWFCVEVNFADLLKGLGGMSHRTSQKTPVASASLSPTG